MPNGVEESLVYEIKCLKREINVLRAKYNEQRALVKELKSVPAPVEYDDKRLDYRLGDLCACCLNTKPLFRIKMPDSDNNPKQKYNVYLCEACRRIQYKFRFDSIDELKDLLQERNKGQ